MSSQVEKSDYCRSFKFEARTNELNLTKFYIQIDNMMYLVEQVTRSGLLVAPSCTA